MVKESAYPVLGIGYFIAHPSLWKDVFCGMLLCLIVNIVSLVGFSFLIRPTADALIRAGCAVWVGYLIAIPLMLIEVAITVLLFVAIFLPILIEQVFMNTLKLRGYGETLVKNKAPNMDYSIVVASILFGLAQVTVSIICLPLNAIPILGTILFCYFNGAILAWGLRLPEMLLFRGMNFTQGKSYVTKNFHQFGAFGGVAIFLEMIPLLNWLFCFTNSVGAALWAIDEYEKDLKNNTYYEHRTDQSV